MASTFKDFSKHLGLQRIWHYVPVWSYSFTGCIFFVAGCVLGASSLVVGASWIFAVLYFLLGTVGVIICFICRFTILSGQNKERLPLVSYKKERLQSKRLKFVKFPKSINDFNCDGKEKTENSISYDFSRSNINLGHDIPSKNKSIEKGLYINTNRTIASKELISNHNDVCYDQNLTEPIPKGIIDQKFKQDNKIKFQMQKAMNYVMKLLKPPLTSDVETPNLSTSN